MSEVIIDPQIWICECCMLVSANGECCDNDEHGGDFCEPLSQIVPPYSMTLGMLAEEHDSECPNYSEPGAPYHGRDEECDCETDSFSTSPCEACGSRLYGERHAATLWGPDPEIEAAKERLAHPTTADLFADRVHSNTGTSPWDA